MRHLTLTAATALLVAGLGAPSQAAERPIRSRFSTEARFG